MYIAWQVSLTAAGSIVNCLGSGVCSKLGLCPTLQQQLHHLQLPCACCAQ